MSFDLQRVDFLAVGIGLLVWLAAVVRIWMPSVRSQMEARAKDTYTEFSRWKLRSGRPDASLYEYDKASDAKGIAATPMEMTLGLTAAGLLVLCVALIRWGALS